MPQATSSQGQRFGRFNLYDIFANFLPGATLVFGFYLPEFSKDGTIPSVGLGSGVTLAVVSFVLGFGLQAIASPVIGKLDDWTRLKRPFNERMADIDTEDGLEGDFASICDDKFGVKVIEHDMEYEDWSILFKSVLSDLENSPWSRALRIQALHLAARGLTVAFVLLTVYYFLYVLGVMVPGEMELFSHTQVPLAAALGTGVLAVLTAHRSRHFEKDVITYMISEFYMKNRQEFADDSD